MKYIFLKIVQRLSRQKLSNIEKIGIVVFSSLRSINKELYPKNLDKWAYPILYLRLDLRWFQGCPTLNFLSRMYLKGKKGQFSIEVELFESFFCTSKMHNKHHFQSDLRYNCPKNWWFLVKWAIMGLIFDFSWKIPDVLKYIPGVKLPKYT